MPLSVGLRAVPLVRQVGWAEIAWAPRLLGCVIGVPEILLAGLDLVHS